MAWKVGKKAIFNCHNGWEFPGEKIATTTPVPFLPGVTRPARGKHTSWVFQRGWKVFPEDGNTALARFTVFEGMFIN